MISYDGRRITPDVKQNPKRNASTVSAQKGGWSLADKQPRAVTLVLDLCYGLQRVGAAGGRDTHRVAP